MNDTPANPSAFPVNSANLGGPGAYEAAMTDLLKLAERCEAATGPDRELEVAIWLAAVAGPADRQSVEEGRAMSASEANFRAEYLMDGGRYTTSLDAALTLVPEKCEWTIQTDYERDGSKPVANVNWRDRDDDMFIDHTFAYAGTPALALTAAALRAHAAMKEDK